METDVISEASTSVICDNISGFGADELNSFAPISFNGEINGDVANYNEVITRLELDLARASEKLVNLSVLMMHLAMQESEFEALASENDHILADPVERALVIDLLAGFLDSEVNEVDSFMAWIQNYLSHVHEMISLCQHSIETSMDFKEKLCDCEESLKQSHEQISEIRMQSANLLKTLSCLYEENRNEDKGANLLENNQPLHRNAVIDMRTAGQQRHILKMLEKSLAREMDLEKKLTETSQSENQLQLRLHSSEQDFYLMEEKVEDICGRCFEAENASEVFIGISKELLCRLQLLQFNMNGSVQREAELRLKMECSIEQLNDKESELVECKNNNAELNNTLRLQTADLESKLRGAEEKLKVANFESVTLTEKVSSLEKQLKESEKIEALEKNLRESDIQLQKAVASAEASEEKQNMLYATINDMENLIRDLKLKVSKAECRADRAEENCILLSESYAELNEELRLVRNKLDCLETSVQQAEYRKKASAKDIDIRTKVITNLVMQLAIERERLHNRLSSLAMENKTLAGKLQQADHDSSVVTDQSNRVKSKEVTVSKHDFTSETLVDATQLSDAGPEIDKVQDNASIGGAIDNPAHNESNLESMRRIDAGVLDMKHVFIVLSVLVMIFAAYLSSLQD